MSIAFFSYLWLFSKTWKLSKTPSQAILVGRYPPPRFVATVQCAVRKGCIKFCSLGGVGTRILRVTLGHVQLLYGMVMECMNRIC